MLPAPARAPLLSIRESRHVHERAQAPGLAGHARPSSAFFCSQQDCNLSRELPQPRASALLIGGALAGGLAIRHVASGKRSRQCHRYPFACSQVVTTAGKPLSMRLAVPAGSAEEAESSAATVKRRLSTTVPEDCDVVVIGAGLGGLASAAALAKSGRRVVVLEAHTEVGGCAHSFTRRSPSGGEYIFDSGPSIVTEMGLQNPLRQAMDYVGASKYVEWIHYDGWGMLTPEGPWKLCLGPEDFRNNVLPLYNVPASEFDAVAEACAPLAQTGYSIPGVVLRDDDWQLLPLVLKFPGGVIPALRDAAALSEPFSVVLEKLEAEGKLRRDSWLWAWMDALAFSLSGLDCSGTTTAAMAFTMEELHKPRSRGLAYPVGGMGVVVEALAKAVEDHGGLIRTGTKVAEVLLEEEIGGSSSSSAGSSSSSSKSARRRAVGVRYGKKGDMMLRASENVVCNAAVWDAAGLVQGESEPLDQLRSDWRSTPMTRSYLHLHVGLDASGLDLASLQPHYTHMDNWENVTEEMNMVAISNPCLLDPSLAPEGKLTLHLYCAGNEAFEPWQAKLQEGGRSAYEAMKEERAARLWRALELVIPDARSRAEVALVGSPLTHRRYLRREAGTYGAAPVFGRFGPGKLPFRTASDARSSSGGAVEGLLLCGDSTFPGIGVPAAVISGLSAAHTSMSVWEHLGLLGRAGY